MSTTAKAPLAPKRPAEKDAIRRPVDWSVSDTR